MKIKTEAEAVARLRETLGEDIQVTKVNMFEHYFGRRSTRRICFAVRLIDESTWIVRSTGGVWNSNRFWRKFGSRVDMNKTLKRSRDRLLYI